jgi:FkbM family methyltransferase
MMERAGELGGQVLGLARTLKWKDFLRWLLLLVLYSPQVLRTGSLGAIDQKFGTKFSFWCAGRWWRLRHADLGVIREIVAGRCYSPGRELADARIILDLGANCGIFTLFALAHAPEARVTAVEMNSPSVFALTENLALNGVAGRVQVVQALAGSETPDTAQVRRTHPEIALFDIASWMDSVGECDFFKCDIEGSEYGLINEGSTWLRKVRRASLEYHGSWEEGETLARVVRDHGFHVTQRPHGSLGYLFCTRSN